MKNLPGGTEQVEGDLLKALKTLLLSFVQRNEFKGVLVLHMDGRVFLKD